MTALDMTPDKVATDSFDFDMDEDPDDLPTPPPRKEKSSKKKTKTKQRKETLTEDDNDSEDQSKNHKKRTEDADNEINVLTKTEQKDKTKCQLISTAKKRKHNDDPKKSRREERQALLEKVPKADADGIAYTKLQLRRMVKRIQKGLCPIPTPQEQHELRLREVELQKEDEVELAGMVYNKSEVTGRKEEADYPDEEETCDDIEQVEVDDEQDEPDPFVPSKTNPQPPSKKTKRSKPVPPDYTCMACSIHADHWIYDCPNKVTKRGTNLVAKKLRGIHAPDARKVFVSGLPFEMKQRDVESLFAACGKIAHCKLVTFADTGRCKGQAFISFDTDEGAKLALKLNGQALANETAPKKKGKKEAPSTGATEEHRKELKLKVTKVLNRVQTKGNSSACK